MWYLLLGVAVVVGISYMADKSPATLAFGAPPGSGGDPARRGPNDIRDGWNPRVIECREPARFAMMACGRKFYSSYPYGGRITNGFGGALYFPGFLNPFLGLDYRDCRPPLVRGGRGWWGAIEARFGDPTRALVADCEWLADSGREWEGPEGAVVTRMAVTLGGEVMVRSDQSTNFRDCGVRGGTLWVGNSGWIAVDANGRDLSNVVLTYKGDAVPAYSWPGEVQPWKAVAEGSRRTAMVLKGDRHDAGGHVAPWDACAGVYLKIIGDRPRVLARGAK